ncbi:1-acyl-sn-glycerol-3-phosphate acyltransferase, putative [Eimeria maxima]|uniref:1-acyl-sn-glycerol-3-phosphate acyltransferase, putative n=1 Tax=Eimeria maxima TaxID=5804 RepID=U6M3D9_EIMMA|nr:1-acyl-sn-glycerol-3-phosphate acyltransferase, putative [Eimeria maxima]CDJ56210.1 1-acyl-sn-glycerol-3-phosphate acyltransferase, putative [Eimeria maxima]
MNIVYTLCRPFWRQRILRPLPSGVSTKKVIVMVNHTSKVDPWVVGSILLGYPSIYVVKRSLLKVPIAGWALYMAGALSVQFTKEKGGWGTQPGSVQDMMKEALRNLYDGVLVVVFPEGTRSVCGRLQPFKKGFFRLAVENPDIFILPIAIHNNFRLWPVTSKLLYPGTSYVAVGDLISAQGLTAEELCNKTHEEIFNLLKLSPEFNPLREQPLTEAAGAREHGL